MPLAEAGYTIVETMIFLIVTGALMASAALLFSGKISRSQFTVGVRQFNSTINNTINDVSTGTYNASPYFSCTSGGVGSPNLLKQAADTQGSNTGCIFVGKVLHPGYDCSSDDLSKCTTINTYTAVANRQASGSDATDLFSSKPILADSSDPDKVDLTDHQTLPNGLFVTAIFGINGSGQQQTYGAIGIFQTFPQASGGNLQSGAQHVQVIPLDPVGYPAAQTDIDRAVTSVGNDQVDVSGGVVICLSGGGKASITIGLDNSNLTTNVNIGDSRCRDI